MMAGPNSDGYVFCFHMLFTEGSLEVKLPTIWTDGKAEVGKVREEKIRKEKRREEERRSEKRKSQRKEDAGARNLWLRRVKNRLAKAAGAEPSGCG